jgi:hypothetical protein
MEMKLPEEKVLELHPNGKELQDQKEPLMEILELEVIQMNSTLEDTNAKIQMPFGKLIWELIMLLIEFSIITEQIVVQKDQSV